MNIDPTRCPSCQAPRSGVYCASCGERLVHEGDLDLRHFVAEELPHEIFHLDGKLPRTLRRLFTDPGGYAADFVGGMRRPYVSPLRLYLLVFVLHALVTSFFVGHSVSIPQIAQQAAGTAALMSLAEARPDVHWDDGAVRERLAERGHWLSEGGTVVIVLIVAVLQQLVFIRSRRRYLEHVTLGLGICTIFALTVAVGKMFIGVFARPHFSEYDAYLQAAAGSILIPVYWFLGIRRFYGLSVRWAALSAAAMSVGHIFIAVWLSSAMLAVLIVTA